MTATLARPGPGVAQFTSTLLLPFERGLEFGRAFPAQVGATIAYYRDRLAAAPQPLELADGGALALEAIEGFRPVAAAEIRGIAEGAQVPVEHVAGINARTELLAIADPGGAAECSTIVSAPEGGPVRGAQTWDWYTAMRDGWLLWTIPLAGGRQVSTMTEYGIVGKIGVNDAGLGVLFSILHHERDGQGGVGVPVHVLARAVLEDAVDVGTALELAAQAEVTASSTLTLLDPTSAASAELFPGGRGVVRPESGWLVRSNHFLSAEGAPGCRDHTRGSGSRVRHAALREAVHDAVSASDAGLVGALAGHDPNGPLCAHSGPGTAEGTLATVVVDTAAPSIAVWRGWPCATPVLVG